MPQIADAALTTALKQAKTRAMFFAFVAKGTSDGALIVSKPKIATKQVAETKKKVGGSVVFRGRCVGEEGKLVFEVAKEPPSGLAKQLKTIIARDAGLTLKVEVRVAADLAAEESEAAAEAMASPAPPPAAADKAAVMKRLGALTGPYQAAVAAKGPDVARMQSLIGAVKGLLGKQDFEQAGKALDELEPLVARAQAAPNGAPPADAAVRFTARLKALLPQIVQAQAGSGPAGQEVKARASDASTFARNKNFAQANAVLDWIEALLKNAQPAPDKAAALWNIARGAAVTRLRNEIKEILATNDPDAAKAGLELKAVLNRLTSNMETRQQATEMARYLRQDDVVADICELAFDLQTPLLKVLNQMTPLLPA
jgi:hypothetical protein